MGIWQITKKDLRLILNDRGALYTLLALPVVFIAILGMSTGQLMNTRTESKLLKVGVVDESSGETSAAVVKNLSSIGGMKVSSVSDRDEAKRELQNGRSNVAVIIGPQFSDRVENLSLTDVFNTDDGKLKHGMSTLDVRIESSVEFVNVSELVEYVVLSSILRVVVPEVARRSPVIRRMMDRAKQNADFETALTAATNSAEPIKAGSSIVYQTLVPAFMVMFAFFLINIMADSFILERKLGTLRRLQASPISPAQLMWGKTLPFLIVSIMQSLMLFLSGKLLFGMSWGTHPWMLLPVVLTTSLSAAGLGLLVATIVRTESQVASYATFLVIVLAGISGCYMPRAWLPELMQNISLATPHAWALIAYQELLTREHPQLLLVCECCAVLFVFGTLFFTIGCQRFRKLDFQH